MNKRSRILTLVLGVMIIIVLILLSLTPVFKDRSVILGDNEEKEVENEKGETLNEELENEKEEIEGPLLSDNVVDISLGINSLIHGDGARVKGSDIVIEKGGTYNISGELLNGTIYVDTIFDVLLKLNGVNITSSKEAINIKGANVVLELANNNFLDSNEDGIVSNATVDIKGDGQLLIHSLKSGVVSLDGVNVLGGDIIIFSENKTLINEKSSQKGIDLSFKNVMNDIFKVELKKQDDTVLSGEAAESFHNIFFSSPKINDDTYQVYKVNEQNIGEVVLNEVRASKSYNYYQDL